VAKCFCKKPFILDLAIILDKWKYRAKIFALNLDYLVAIFNYIFSLLVIIGMDWN